MITTHTVNYRGATISKLTNIPITNISAIKSTDSDTDTNITTSMDSLLLLLQMLQIYFSLLSDI